LNVPYLLDVLLIDTIVLLLLIANYFVLFWEAAVVFELRSSHFLDSMDIGSRFLMGPSGTAILLFMLLTISGITGTSHDAQLFSTEMDCHRIPIPDWQGSVIFPM
jgi:hypothetical protein